jgi:phosphoribosylaminoimidazole-succinocarboxamide synthase
MSTLSPLYESTLQSLPRIHRGKVRDIYAVGSEHLLIITTDRVSAFDVIFDTAIPNKGKVLNQISNFWFEKLKPIIPNHLDPTQSLKALLPDPEEYLQAEGRSVIVKKLQPLPVEAIVRGYLSGSGWSSYRRDGTVCGLPLPAGLKEADQLPEPIFTPSTKAAVGEHDENIDFETLVTLIGEPRAKEVRDVTLALYQAASQHALERGIIIADTKFEFGVDEQGVIHLIDEALTPDSSRFWPLDTYRPDSNPPSFDTQVIRDYLETLDWNKKAPAPPLPDSIVQQAAARYQEAAERLCT